MSSSLIPADRQKRIYNLLREQGVVKVNDISKLLGVSELTIRRDLDLLEKKEILERTHGGAIYNQRMPIEPLYEQKHKLHKEEKKKIGRYAAELIEEGDTILINSGSTTLEVIHNLRNKSVRVITNNLGAVFEAGESKIELLMPGGLFRVQSNSLVGDFTQILLKRVYGSKAIIGVDGVSIKYGLTTPILEEAEVANNMIESTVGEVIVVADHSKLGVVSNFVSAPMKKVNILVTDDKIDDEYRNSLEKIGIRVVIASCNAKAVSHL